jgi:prepilin-type N-terminal cleavage/methylation domain-containing protein
MKICNLKKNKGFTLIELLLSVALFSIVVVIAFGAIITTVDINRKSQTLTTVMNDLNFTLESMTRTIKTSTEISDFGSLYRFKDQRSNTNYVTYRYNSDSGLIEKCESASKDSCGNYIPIVSNQIKITNFYLEPVNRGASKQPRFLMVVEGYAEASSRVRSDFIIQTTVSPRTVNFSNALKFE